MKVLELLAHLGVWPFDTAREDGGFADSGMSQDQTSHAQRHIVLPQELRPVVVEARWPTEYARRTMH